MKVDVESEQHWVVHISLGLIQTKTRAASCIIHG